MRALRNTRKFVTTTSLDAARTEGASHSPAPLGAGSLAARINLVSMKMGV
jgi:hypothetical protein